MGAVADWVAVDWGTSRLRVWVFGPSGEELVHLESDDGMGALAPGDFEPALLRLIGAYLAPNRATPVIACGMVGARQGWAEADYVAAPCVPPGAGAGLRVATGDPRLDVTILPGVSQRQPADVMRGEETKIAGFLAADPAFDGTLCLPGTHSKWVQLSAGEIVSFRTFMTGDLFAAICGHTVLRHSVGEGWDDAAFLAAIREGMAKPAALANRLFSLRAEGLLAGLSGAEAVARVSGLLTGMEIAAARGYWLGTRVALVGSGPVMAAYRAALKAEGVPCELADGDEMVLAGLRAARARKGAA